MPLNTQPAWKTLREMAGLSQREVERRCQWKSSGRLSVIERGLVPTDQEANDLMRVLMDAISEKAASV